MKFAIVTAALLAGVSAQAFTFFGRFEIAAQGDFDGDGRADAVIIDRSNGSFRIGYQTAPNAYTWSDPRATGVENVTGATVGKLFQTSRDSLALASTVANRVNLIDAPTPTGSPVPVSVYPPGIGPNQVIAYNLAVDTAHDDLIVPSNGSGAPNPTRIALMKNDAASVSLLLDQTYPEISTANRVFLKKTAPEVVGVMISGAAADEFRLLAPGTNNVNQMYALTGLPRGSQFIAGNFGGALFNHVVFFRPGDSNIISRLSTEPSSGVFGLGAANSFPLAKTIAQLYPLSAPSADRLLALFQDGSATVYTFNGSSAPTVFQNLSADAGETLSTAIPIAGGDMLMFSGRDGKSANVRRYTGTSSNYVAGLKSSLPTSTPLSAGANVFVFRQEPFVSNQPDLLESVNAGDWTSDLSLAGANYSANVWNFLGGSLGLRNPVNVNFGPVPPTGFFGLANQYTPSISLFSRAPAVGEEVVDVRISPEAGEYKTAIKVTLSTTLPGAQIYFKTSSDTAWQSYTGTPIALFKTTLLQYYARPIAGDRKSRIHSAMFTFPIDPSVQDSDHDGVPDYVEIAKGLNPNGGKDQDGDGFTDLNELIAGTDPLVKTNSPTDAQRLEQKSAFDLVLGLQPLDGTTGANTTIALGANLRTYDLYGSIQRAGVAANLGVAGVTDPASRLTNVLLDTDPPLIIAATDAHFDIATPGSDKHLGRELLSIIPAPRPPLPEVTYAYSGGDIATEAAHWISAAQALYASVPHETVKNNLDINDVLVALLFERKISQILQQRGNPAWSNLTLFPFRPTDSGRTNPPPTLLKSVEARVDDTHPGYKLATLQAEFQDEVNANAPAGMIALKTLTKEIYRISSASNNAAPAKYPSPVDTLRGFFETGVLNSNYLAIIGPVDLTAAHNAYVTGLSIVDARPTATLDLVVRSDTFDGTCTILDTSSLPAVQKSLIHPGGEQYRLLESFNLIPGSHVHVFGYTDVTNTECSVSAVEVITLALDSVPEVTAVDTDGDLMLDALEFLLFGSLSNSGLGDADGDGFSNLQEALDGTDPNDAGSHGGTIVSLSPPAIVLSSISAFGDVHLSFDFPAAYASSIHFAIKSTAELGQPFNVESITPVNTGGNHFEVTLPNPGTTHKFYLLTMSAM